MTFRCSIAAVDRGDGLEGTASTVRAFLLVENPGPWGIDALRHSRMPGRVMDVVRRAAASAKVRPLLVRRYHRSAPRDHFRVFAGWTGPGESWLETTILDTAPDLIDLAERLGDLGQGRSPGLEPVDGPVFFVCTHGRHDACCAEQGRPVAAALDAAFPDRTWEVSHLGGDRFAANALVLPHGLYLGRLDPETAVAAARAVVAGRLPVDVLRGRTCLPMPVQAAEIALLRHLGESRIGAVSVAAHGREGQVTTADLVHAADTWRVVVRTTAAAEALLTCRATRESLVPVHEVVSLARKVATVQE